MYRTYNDIPKEKTKKHIKGSSPELLKKLMEELNGAKEIHLSFFLYNNPYLHKMIENLADDNTVIKIYSIPLNGYDTKDVFLYDCDNKNIIRSSKYELAEKIYSGKVWDKPNISLNIFPYTYVWKKQKFSRGSNLYCLHNKSILAKFDGNTKCLSSSCNFAAGDPPHSENLLIIENSPNAIRMFNDYFTHLDQFSYSISEYNNLKQHDFQIPCKPPVDLKDVYETDYFTGPFIKYNGTGSNRYVKKKIIEFIRSAKKRVYICSQHFNDIDSYGSYGSLVEELVSLSEEIDIKVLKQTRAYNQAQGDRTLKSEKVLRSKRRKVLQKYWESIIHDKFIIVV